MNIKDPDAYWVAPGELLAGEYPGDWDDDRAGAKVRILLDAGIRSFVDLTEAHELTPYEPLIAEAAAERGVEVRYRRMSVEDLGTPTLEHMSSLLAHIDCEIAAGRPVYVHCWGGIGRTGTVVGCWLVHRQVCTPAGAVQRIAELRAGIGKAHRPSPETAAQREFIARWTADDERG